MIPILLFLLHIISAAKAQQICSSIVDLSQTYFDKADDFNINQDSAKLLDLIQSEATSNDQVYSYLLLENGKKIAEYYNEFLNATADTTHDVYSITKSWTGLLFGIMIDQGQISLDQKVGDIWSYLDEVWASVDDEAEEVKDVTVDQLLSMTSGFVDVSSMAEIDFANWGGADLAGVLNYVVHSGQENEGKFNYLGFANILGYIVDAVTGKTAVEYARTYLSVPGNGRRNVWLGKQYGSGILHSQWFVPHHHPHGQVGPAVLAKWQGLLILGNGFKGMD